VEIIQLVHLYKDGEKMKMSKRTGKAVTMRELVEEVGLDAVRYFFAMRSADTQMDFALDLGVWESNENPVYYAQYAPARISSIMRSGDARRLSVGADVDFTSLSSEISLDLLKDLRERPHLIADAAQKSIAHGLTHCIYGLASTVHRFYA